jgi:8-oxo-dGTP pyrophosphatase MutT (NUDIX family)
VDSYRLAALKEHLRRVKPSGDDDGEPPRAAVAIVLREPSEGDEAEVLFIRRSERADDPWSGHIAFPGGRRHDEDADLLATALRETREEIGLDLATTADLLVALAPMAARARGKKLTFSIAPFVFALRTRDVALTLDPREVAEVIWKPLGALARGEGRSTHTIDVGTERYELPAFLLGSHVLWGLTFGMLESLLAVLAAEHGANKD